MLPIDHALQVRARHAFDDLLILSGTREMLWLQYEASKEIDELSVRRVIEKVAEHMHPFPVAAFDAGPFGVGLLVCDLDDSSSESNTSRESLLPVETRYSDDAASDELYSHSGTSQSEPSIGCGYDEGHHANPSTDQSPRSWTNDRHFSRTRVVNGGSERNGETSDFRGDGACRRSRGNGNPQRFNKLRHNRRDDEENENDSSEQNDRDSLSPPPRRKRRMRNNRFTGKVTLCVQDKVKQRLTVMMGLCIIPTVGRDFVDCQIVLDPIRATASPLSADDNDMLNLASHHFYIMEQATILVGPKGGTYDLPVSARPMRHHFAAQQTTSKVHRIEANLEASISPKLNIRGSKESGKIVDYDPVTLAYRPTYIGEWGEDHYQWQYEPVGPPGTNLDLIAHEVTFRVYEKDFPESMRIVIQATFRKKGKLRRQKFAGASRDFVSRLCHMHVATNLAIEIGNYQSDWFKFPASDKEGTRLFKTVSFDGETIGAGKTENVSVGGVKSTLGSKNCS